MNKSLKFIRSWLWTRCGLSLLALAFLFTTLGCRNTTDKMSAPYTNYMGKLIVTVDHGTVWSNAAKHPFVLRRCFLTSGTNAAPADPSEPGTAPVKLAEFPAGTQVKLEAVKGLSELDHEEVFALATLSFTNGKSIKFQSRWWEFDPSSDQDTNFQLGEFPSTRIDIFREGETPKRKYRVLSAESCSSGVRLKDRAILIENLEACKGDKEIDGIIYTPLPTTAGSSMPNTYNLSLIHYLE